MAAAGLHLLLLLLARAQGTAPPETCCEVHLVTGQGELDGWYTLNTSPTASLESVCLDACIYRKLGDEGTGREYCFKSAALDYGGVQCTALPTDAPVTGSTLPPTEDNLNNEKRDLEQDLANDEKELEGIQAEENDATAVDSGLTEAAATIDRLTGGEATTSSDRVKRQAAKNCKEIATLVDEMEVETNTKNKLKIIQRITTTTITICSEGDRQILKEKKEVIKRVKVIVKKQIVKIRKKKVKVSMAIYKKKNKIKNVVAMLIALVAPAKPPRPIIEAGSGKGPDDESGDGSGSEEPTGSGEEPIAITFRPTGRPSGEEPIKITFRPTGRPSGEEPIKITFRPTGRPSGEEPIKITFRPTGRPSGEEPIKITFRPTGRPGGEEPIKITFRPTGEPSGEEPITFGSWPTWKPTGWPSGEKPMNMMMSGPSPKPTGGVPTM